MWRAAFTAATSLAKTKKESVVKILITGAAGFIGCHCAQRLASSGYEVIGVDNLNDYYDVRLKEARLALLSKLKGFRFFKLDLTDRAGMADLFQRENFDLVLHLGAQAGVRYSIENPFAYTDSNITGTLTVLEGCRRNAVKHLIYASSSSVYGANTKQPFSTDDRVDSPVSLYAATKKANELMCQSYAHLYGLPCTGLRFFTVYGPWGRPDMAYFKFAVAITKGKPIEVYNYGNMKRDFTYIDDIVDGIKSLVDGPLPPAGSHKVYNFGNNKPEKLTDLIEALEQSLERNAVRIFLPMQPGDVPETFADIDNSQRDLGFKPSTSLREGISRFSRWFREHIEKTGI
ncbi:UDP-glucuronate 4-epimerase [Pseudoxanthomonas taiwanensis J19]|uniref:UDP-glucuronate 4-epimerase n=1 Tax=Pseudoxanthomonas taiwanensis J19 TaxID=935569 RepID=A0A562DI75_9GAMM|nr:UDP-glucuronate 4-epimerase [Pseudoxanthomonas taiwanensis J19]